ncbi:helix-turn-helix transcriptional regulator [Clostridium sp. ZBS17]|uniref:helix-turn-helix transcriptional regulator n=1 Tax=Clostridium sp. ZBS17 TaxID=2949968 RepID=UPI002079EC4A|nr:helix-turn-helix transcriptional regulator [Clostridium sp. ZBS17]
MLKIDIEKLLLERAIQELTLEELSKRSGVGRSTISRIERGESKGRINTIAKIVKGLGKTIEDFRIKE